MSNNYECSIGDLFDLFDESLEPADVLTSKLMAQISTTVTRERIKLHMNQADFAKHISASQSLVSRWEHGDYNFSIKKLADIATRLNLDVNISIVPQNAGDHYTSASFSNARTICFSKKTKPAQQQTYTTSTYREGKNYAAVC